MANMCTNQVYLVGPISEITTLFENIQKWRAKSREGDLESIALGAGFELKDSYNDEPSNFKVVAEGDFMNDPVIYQDSEDEARIYFETETKWFPQSKLWIKLLEKYAPNSKYYHFSVEPGSELYITNDENEKYFDTSYVVDYYNEDGLIDEIIDDEFEYGLNYFGEEEYRDTILDILNNIVSNEEKVNNESLVDACKNIISISSDIDNDVLTNKFEKVLKDHLSLDDDYKLGFIVHKVYCAYYDPEDCEWA